MKATEISELFESVEDILSEYGDFDISINYGDYIIALVYYDEMGNEITTLLFSTNDPDEADYAFDDFADLLGEDNVVKLTWDYELDQYSEIEFYEGFNIISREIKESLQGNCPIQYEWLDNSQIINPITNKLWNNSEFNECIQSVMEIFTWVVRGKKKVKKNLRKVGVRPKVSVAVRNKIKRSMKRQRHKLKRIAKLPKVQRKRKISIKRRKALSLKPTKKGYKVIGR